MHQLLTQRHEHLPPLRCSLATEIAKNGPIGVRCAKTAVDVGIQTDLTSGMEVSSGEECLQDIVHRYLCRTFVRNLTERRMALVRLSLFAPHALLLTPPPLSLIAGGESVLRSDHSDQGQDGGVGGVQGEEEADVQRRVKGR